MRVARLALQNTAVVLALPYITIEAYSGVEVVVALEKQQSATVMIEKKICIKQKINSRDRAKK